MLGRRVPRCPPARAPPRRGALHCGALHYGAAQARRNRDRRSSRLAVHTLAGCVRQRRIRRDQRLSPKWIARWLVRGDSAAVSFVKEPKAVALRQQRPPSDEPPWWRRSARGPPSPKPTRGDIVNCTQRAAGATRRPFRWGDGTGIGNAFRRIGGLTSISAAPASSRPKAYRSMWRPPVLFRLACTTAHSSAESSCDTSLGKNWVGRGTIPSACSNVRALRSA